MAALSFLVKDEPEQDHCFVQLQGVLATKRSWHPALEGMTPFTLPAHRQTRQSPDVHDQNPLKDLLKCRPKASSRISGH